MVQAKKKASAAKGADGALKLARNGPGPADVHVFGKDFVCDTEQRGHATPRGRSPLEIVVDASEGFIPLWARDVVLRWRFREQSMKAFENAASAKAEIRKLFGDALLAWGSAAPVKFAERDDGWDFELVMMKADNCDAHGCVLASAFFPDAGRHALRLYPQLFEQTRQEQVETLVHEIGHVFGLRHFFANISETQWPSQIFGTHAPFSIMNYGSKSVLTADDKDDLKRLYQLAWSGKLEHINGTKIRLMRPYHESGTSPTSLMAVSELQPIGQPLPRAAYPQP
jgi:hypothetical protein